MKKSVLNDLYSQEPVCTEINDALVPSVFTDTQTEYNVFRHGIAIIDGIGYAILRLEGDRVVEKVDALVTKDIRYLNSGKIEECFFLNTEAEIIGMSYIVNDDDSVMAIIPPENAKAVTDWIHEKIGDSVKIIDMTQDNHLFFLEGEKSWKVVEETFDFPIDTLPLRDMVKIDYDAEKLMLSRIGRSGEYGYAIIGSKDKIHKLVEYLLSSFDLKWCGTEALYICMLEINQPLLDCESVRKGNIFELAYQWFVQYDKEDYFGKEALLSQFEKRSERACVGFFAPDVKAVDPDAKVYLEDELIGDVICGRFDPALNGVIGHLLIDKGLAVAGISLEVVSGKDSIPVKTVSSPFIRPLSWDSQMG